VQNERQVGRGGFLRRADANEDGVITRAEFDASAGERFARRDDNSDGAITQDERQGRGGGGADNGGGSDRRGGRMMDADVDEDGTITRAEFDASQNEMFTRFDADQSGAIESSELPQRRTD
jgi:Ca2+-binding EF-hand superfamily protein